MPGFKSPIFSVYLTTFISPNMALFYDKNFNQLLILDKNFELIMSFE